MRVGILTFHSAYNYGAVLQAYALNKVIQSMGIECDVIDYRPPYFEEIYCLKAHYSFRQIPIKMWLKQIMLGRIVKERSRNFEEFIKNNISLTNKTFRNVDDMRETNLSYDVYIAGSDQVWSSSCAEFDKVYFLDFPAASSKKKVSYAASFGATEIECKLREQYKKRLKNYSAFCVREESGVHIIEQLLERTATVACDPTLLLDKREWEQKVNKQPRSDKYILLYYVDTAMHLREYALELAREMECKVIAVTSNMKWTELLAINNRKKNIETFCKSSPEEFLSLIYNASCVVTSSFHGTVFSLLFHKEFYVDIELNNGRVNNRVVELLKKFDLEDRIIHTKKILRNRNIDWEYADKVRNEMGKEGIEYLRGVLQPEV